MKTLRYLLGIFTHPIRTGRELAGEKKIHYALLIVLAISGYLALGFLSSYIKGDYPPDAKTLEVWIKAWGSFSMLPIVNIPLEKYRLFMAIVGVPVGLMIWMLGGVTAWLLTRLFKGTLNFHQLLNFVAFTIFPFWLLSGLLDPANFAFINVNMVAALSGELGPLAQGFYTWYPQIMYPVVQGLGALFLGILIQTNEKQKIWKSALTAFLAFCWVIVVTTLLFR